MADKKYWLLERAEGASYRLGEAERHLRGIAERRDAQAAIPRGWRLVETKDGRAEFALSRFMSLNAQEPVLTTALRAMRRVTWAHSPDENGPRSFVDFWAGRVASCEDIVRVQAADDILRVALGSATCVRGTHHRPLVDTLCDDAQIGPAELMRMVEDGDSEDHQRLGESIRATRKRMSRENCVDEDLGRVWSCGEVPAIPASELTSHAVRGLVEVVHREAGPVQPYFSGRSFAGRGDDTLSLYLALYLVREWSRVLVEARCDPRDAGAMWAERFKRMGLSANDVGLHSRFLLQAGGVRRYEAANDLEAIGYAVHLLVMLLYSSQVTGMVLGFDYADACVMRLGDIAALDRERVRLADVEAHLRYVLDDSVPSRSSALLASLLSSIVLQGEADVSEEAAGLFEEAVEEGNLRVAAQHLYDAFEARWNSASTLFRWVGRHTLCADPLEASARLKMMTESRALHPDLVAGLFGAEHRVRAFEAVCTLQSADWMGQLSALAPPAFWDGPDGPESTREDSTWM